MGHIAARGQFVQVSAENRAMSWLVFDRYWSIAGCPAGQEKTRQHVLSKENHASSRGFELSALECEGLAGFEESVSVHDLSETGRWK